MDDLPNYSRILNLISESRDPEKLMAFVANAQKKNVPEVRDAALNQLNALRPARKGGSFEFAFWDMLMAYQKVLLENARPTKRLMKAWGMALSDDEAQALTQWVENGEQAWAFDNLISQGLVDITAEKLVLRFPKRFEPEICDQARQRVKMAVSQSKQIA